MVLGSLLVFTCLVVLGWTKEIVSHFVEEGEFRRECTIALAIIAIYGIDFSINAGKSRY
jgi:solute carrier family 45 protein 1/2/4